MTTTRSVAEFDNDVLHLALELRIADQCDAQIVDLDIAVIAIAEGYDVMALESVHDGAHRLQRNGRRGDGRTHPQQAQYGDAPGCRSLHTGTSISKLISGCASTLKRRAQNPLLP
jgi:hypothetical protein